MDEKMKESIILAVDGGATKTTLGIQTSGGERLFEATAAGSNYQTIGANAVIEVLSDLLQKANFATKLETIDVAIFAMAGIDTQSDFEALTHIVQQALNSTHFNINKAILENDVQAALLGLVGHQPGVLLISGTGSIALATDGNGNVVRTGGWGHRAGDEGSGYWIGRQILKAIFRAEDKLEAPTILKKLVFEKLQIDSIDQLMTWLYQADYTNAQTASLSTVLQEAVSLNDEKAISIAELAAKELFLLVKASLNKLRYKGEPFKVFLNGGILKYHPLILNSLQQLIREDFHHISLSLCDENPIESIVKRAQYALLQ